MRSLIGSLLVIFSCGMAGVAAARELKQKARAAEEMLRITGEMQTEVCLRRTPLTRLLSELERRHPSRFAGAGETGERLDDVPFGVLWEAVIRTMRLPREVENPLLRLGSDLSGGEPPQIAFEACQAQLESCRDAFRRRQAENNRLYPALGFAAGCMAVILLL